MKTELMILFSVFLLLFTSCILQKAGVPASSAPAQPSSSQPSQAVPVQTQQANASTVQNPADVIVNCTKKSVSGASAVLVYYASGQKETFADYCPNKDQPAFQVFLVHYSCQDHSVKQVLIRCSGNMTCNNGVCTAS